jgi:hypothetical protein
LEFCVFVALALDLPWAFGGVNPKSQQEGNGTKIIMETNDVFSIIDYRLDQNSAQLNYHY